MRWLHISSMATLVGGLIYARLAMTPACGARPGSARSARRKGRGAFRPLAFTAMAGLLVSGLYQRDRLFPATRPAYHVLLGVKLLLAAHVFATVI